MRQIISTLAACALLASAAFAQEEINYSTFAMADPPTKALVQKVVTGLGGEAALRSIRSVRKVASIHEKSKEGALDTEFDGTALFPDSLRATLQMSKGQLTAVITKDVSFVYPVNAAVKGAAIKLNDGEKKTLTQYFYEDPFLYLKNRVDPNALFARGPQTKLNGRDTDVLYVHILGLDVAWYVDGETGRVVRTKAGAKTVDFTDFRTVGNVTLPFSSTASAQGSTTTTVCKRYEFNPPIDTVAMFNAPSLWMTRRPIETRKDRYRSSSSYSSYGDYSYGSYGGYDGYYGDDSYDSMATYIIVLYDDYW
jgi:hypothetical protein